MADKIEELKVLYAFIEALIKENTTEDNMYTAIAERTGKGIIASVRVYKKFLKDTDRAMSADDRKQLIKSTLDKLVIAADKQVEGSIPVLDNALAIESIVEALDVSEQAARSTVKKYCEAIGAEFAVRSVITKDALAKYEDFVLGGINAGASKKDVTAKIIKEFKVEEKVAQRIYSRVAKNNGLIKTQTPVDLKGVIAYIKSNMELDVAKKVFRNKLELEFGVTPNASGKLYMNWRFALIWDGTVEAPDFTEDTEVEAETA